VQLSEGKTRVSVLLDDLNFGYHTESQVTQYLNDAQAEVQKYLIQAGQNWYTKCKQAALVVGSCEYYLPSDLLKINRVEVVTGTSNSVDTTYPLEPITLNQQDLIQQTQADPSAYVVTKNRIKLFPVPQIARTLKLTYSYRASALVLDTESFDVPEEFEEMIVLLAFKTGALRDDRNTAQIDGKIAMYLTSLKQAAADRVQQRSRRIVVTGSDYNSGNWY
jgi:hypothetical protein